jgi:hypothetical protein
VKTGWRATIDRHYGHLARDGREHAINLLDALNVPWTLVGARWTPNEPFGVSPENESGREKAEAL